MEWRDLEVWRRQRWYVRRELRKDAPDHLARLGLATSFALAVGMVEGARVSALKGDLKFPLRYAVYNVFPSFVGGKVPPSSVASTMATPPPLRSCPRAAAHATNLRALRTAVAGCTVLSILFQISLAGNRGTEAYEQAVSEGREVPSLAAASESVISGTKESSSSSAGGGVVRLCGAEGLESALVAPRRAEYRTPILPVVVSGPATCPCRGGCASSPGSSLPDGARAAIAKHFPRPCYYRVDPRRLLCREAWRPVSAEVAAAAAGRKGEDVVLVIEADALSSDAPQGLLSSSVEAFPSRVSGSSSSDRVSGGVGDSECRRTGWLGIDQAVWGLAMLRGLLEEGRGARGGRVAGVLLAERRLADVGAATVSIDARAALLLSVFSWAQQCVAEAVASEKEKKASRSASLRQEEEEEEVADEATAKAPEGTEDRKNVGQVVSEINAAGLGADSDSGNDRNRDDDSEESSRRGAAGEAAELGNNTPSELETRESADTTARALALLERIGRRVRVVVSPEGRVRSTINLSLGVVSAGLESLRSSFLRGEGGGRSRVLVYDTDDDESYRWLAAQMLRHGWRVTRAGSHQDARKAPGRFWGGAAGHHAPVLVHRCSDEQTLTAAAGHVSLGAKGSPVCAVVHRWDCGAEARRLLLASRGTSTAQAEGRHVSTAVICTAEVGEDLFQFVRGQLRSGASPEQVQGVVDDLFGGFYDAGPNSSRQSTDRSRVGTPL